MLITTVGRKRIFNPIYPADEFTINDMVNQMKGVTGLDEFTYQTAFQQVRSDLKKGVIQKIGSKKTQKPGKRPTRENTYRLN